MDVMHSLDLPQGHYSMLRHLSVPDGTILYFPFHALEVDFGGSASSTLQKLQDDTFT